MYIVKNSLRNVFRNKGKNILIAIIFTTIIFCTCIGLSINKAASNLVSTYVSSNPLEVSFNLDMNSLRNSSDKDSFTKLTVDDIKKYGDSSLVKDYYYYLDTSMNSSSLTAVSDDVSNDDSNSDEASQKQDDNNDKRPQEDMGDFRLTAYSNFAYQTDFESGDKKITKGSMISTDSTDYEIVISSDLADANSLDIDSSITLTSPSDDTKTYTFKVVGIYKNTTSDEENFMNISALNSSNTMYTNVTSLTTILNDSSSDSSSMKNSVNARFYLKNNNKLKAFEKEVRNKGLSDYYTVSTNEDTVLQTLKPIKNISSFSLNFLIVIVVIGTTILIVINFLNIRDRKYEIGVLRAIGMTKFKVMSEFILETFFISLFSLVIGVGGGLLLKDTVTNTMLKNEISSYQEQQTTTESNFGKGGFDKPANAPSGGGSNNGNSSNKSVKYVDSLKVSIDGITILELVGITIVITVVSSSIAISFINKYNPNKILQNRN